MRIYLDVAVLLNFFVDLCLLLAANRLAGFPQAYGRCILAAAIGGIYGGICLLPELKFLGNGLWRAVFLGVMGAVAYGWNRSGARRSVLFVLLSMALGGIALGLGSGGFFSLIAGAALVAVLCALGFRGGQASREYVDVELSRGEKSVKLLALRDTGNTLRDPVTGQSVLVVDGQTALTLLGLTPRQLSNPVETVASGVLAGLRLIPYRTVGRAGGMLLAVRMENVRIGKWRGSTLVAFAPEGLGGEGMYQALTGGMV